MIVTTAIPPPRQLREIREHLGLSQEELAGALGMSGANAATRIRAWEQSEQPGDVIRPITWTALRMMLMVAEIYRELDAGQSAHTKIAGILPEVLR